MTGPTLGEARRDDTGPPSTALAPNLVGGSAVRPTALSTWLTGAVFFCAFVSRAAWYHRAPMHPDETTVLWMALDAVRDLHLPDHGLISSLHVFQPPGLVWVTLPFVALGGGRPEVVIVGFALLNAAAIAFLVATVARRWGLLYGSALGAFLVVGPDAFYSAWVWHPSLYTAAVALMLAAGIRLRDGSRWWASVLVAIPGLYGLVHYSGMSCSVQRSCLCCCRAGRGRPFSCPHPALWRYFSVRGFHSSLSRSTVRGGI